MQIHLHLFNRYWSFYGIKTNLTYSTISATPVRFFFSLKSTRTSLQTRIISEQNHNRVWNYPEALTVCVLGLSRHLRALVHSEWLHAGSVPSLRITWIRIRFAEDILQTKENSHNKRFCWVGVFQSWVDVIDAKQSGERKMRHETIQNI